MNLKFSSCYENISLSFLRLIYQIACLKNKPKTKTKTKIKPRNTFVWQNGSCIDTSLYLLKLIPQQVNKSRQLKCEFIVTGTFTNVHFSDMSLPYLCYPKKQYPSKKCIKAHNNLRPGRVRLS